MTTARISEKIDRFYNAAAEDKRLTYGLGPLEFERNQELIGRFLPPGPCIALDVGGGPGVYSDWLAGLGHEVYLIDPVEKHIRQAKKLAAKSARKFEAALGEARNLDFKNDFADVVIEHGPLYHLQRGEHRIRALKEAYRVLKPGGVMLGFAINHSISTLTGLFNGMIHDKQFYSMCLDELKTGRHDPPAPWPGILPEAYFHKPTELLDETTEAGFTDLKLFAVEGMIWLDAKYFETRADDSKKERMMALLRETEQSPELLALSPHLMISGRKV